MFKKIRIIGLLIFPKVFVNHQKYIGKKNNPIITSFLTKYFKINPIFLKKYVVDLKDGDIIVSATDGVFDNLFQHEVLSIVKDYRKT